MLHGDPTSDATRDSSTDAQLDQMTMQRFRAMTNTLLDEVSGFSPDYIERQLVS